MEQDRAPAVLPHHHDWRGRPLASDQVIVESIAASTASSGLTLQAEGRPGSFRSCLASPGAGRSSAATRHDWHGEWNYTCAEPARRHRRRRPDRAAEWAHPPHRPHPRLDQLITSLHDRLGDRRQPPAASASRPNSITCSARFGRAPADAGPAHSCGPAWLRKAKIAETPARKPLSSTGRATPHKERYPLGRASAS